jgi:hypothetical protein
MKIGDKVRFLSEVGGGVIAGFKDKNTVLVEDEDGFQMPTLIKDCIVVESDNYDSANVHTGAMPQREQKKTQPVMTKEPEEEPADKEVTFRAKPEERNGGDKLSAYLAFVPVDIKELTKTEFEAYFVNDSNYYIYFTYMSAEGDNWQLRHAEEVEPNTKVFIEQFSRDILNEIEHIGFQMIAYKRDKAFMRKQIVDISFRIDTTKFYKLHTFEENDFFETNSLIYTLVENDRPSHQVNIDAKEMEKRLMEKKSADERGPQPARKRQGDENAIVVDLHANQLLDTVAGMDAHDILQYQLDVFRKTLNENSKKRGQRIIFIHGKGEGVLRHAIENDLKYKYKQYSHQDASFQEYGYGATEVTIK